MSPRRTTNSAARRPTGPAPVAKATPVPRGCGPRLAVEPRSLLAFRRLALARADLAMRAEVPSASVSTGNSPRSVLDAGKVSRRAESRSPGRTVDAWAVCTRGAEHQPCRGRCAPLDLLSISSPARACQSPQNRLAWTIRTESAATPQTVFVDDVWGQEATRSLRG